MLRGIYTLKFVNEGTQSFAFESNSQSVKLANPPSLCFLYKTLPSKLSIQLLKPNVSETIISPVFVGNVDLSDQDVVVAAPTSAKSPRIEKECSGRT